MEMLSIYYDENTNTFEDEYGTTEDSLVGIMTIDDTIKYKQVGGTYYRTIGNVMYELVFPIPDNERILFYNIAFNTMVDENGVEMFNIFSIITPNQLLIFKNGKKNKCFKTIAGGNIQLVYGSEIENEEED